MSAYTRISVNLWGWEPWNRLPAEARLLWLGLYTASEAKRLVPGLFHGSIHAMGDAVRMPPDDCFRALEQLVEVDLVEYDQKLRVLRMTQLPDCAESPANGKVLRSWWTRFHSVPVCGVRDAHVPLLRWLMDQWSRESGKPLSADHETAWKDTFGTMPVPAARRRGSRRLLDDDTSTAVQPSLFAPPKLPVSAASSVALPSGYGMDTHSPSTGESGSVDILEMNKITGPETVSDTVRIPDPEIRSRERFDQGGVGGTATATAGSPKPVLTVVPKPVPFTLAELAAVFPNNCRWHAVLPEAAAQALARAIGDLVVADGRGALELLRDAQRAGVLGDLSPDRLALPGALAAALQKADAWRRDSEAKSAALREARALLGP